MTTLRSSMRLAWLTICIFNERIILPHTVLFVDGVTVLAMFFKLNASCYMYIEIYVSIDLFSLNKIIFSIKYRTPYFVFRSSLWMTWIDILWLKIRSSWNLIQMHIVCLIYSYIYWRQGVFEQRVLFIGNLIHVNIMRYAWSVTEMLKWKISCL